jgi:hypothetical protein
MQVMRDFMTGFVSVIRVIGAPLLYRYPYRTSAEALRADWLNIGKDIDSIMGRLKTDAEDGQRPE